jgi:hypothetical protein
MRARRSCGDVFAFGSGAIDASNAQEVLHEGLIAVSARDGSLAWEFCELVHSRPL